MSSYFSPFSYFLVLPFGKSEHFWLKCLKCTPCVHGCQSFQVSIKHLYFFFPGTKYHGWKCKFTLHSNPESLYDWCLVLLLMNFGHHLHSYTCTIFLFDKPTCILYRTLKYFDLCWSVLDMCNHLWNNRFSFVIMW